VRITRERMAIKIKSEFLSHVSHELKTPLTLIQLYTETLLTDDTLDEADRRYSLQVISRESTNLLNLIENLLHLSGTEQAMEQFNLTEGDLGPVIEKTAGVYAEWLRNQRMELKVSIAQALPLVRFDREKVTRAFLNLLDNAKKYGGDAELIEVGLWSENHKVILEVRDHGPGISEPERKMIFDQFYRGANASESRGVGLGLFLVNETMKAHNGSVDLKTEPGKGSAFRLVFPVSEEDTEGHPGSDV
jgi:two-component system phosphate regulon sensor histidine kinase PhoR